MFALLIGKPKQFGACIVTSWVLFLAACGESPTAPVPAASSTRPAEIPAPHTLTISTSDDVKNAPRFAADLLIQKAVTDYLADPGKRWKLVAARPVGDYVLLWIAFPDIADGAMALVYSTKEQRIGWTFKGSELG